MLRAFAITAAIIVFPAPAAIALEDHQRTDARFPPASPAGKKLVSRSHCANSVSKTFDGVTTWHFCFEAVSPFGLIIRKAAFRKAPTAPLIEILGDMRLSEIFVPYHTGTQRFFDISGHSFPLLKLSTADCPAPRTVIGAGLVCQEVRDRGLAWKNDAW